MTIHATDHALVRYLERVETCSVQDARDRLAHAFEISIPATSRHRKTFNMRLRYKAQNCVLRYCDVENLLLICKPIHRGYLILTVVKAVERKKKRKRAA